MPTGQLLRELVLAIGAALVVGNVAVLIKERRRDPDDARPRPNMWLVVLSIVVGLVMALWGLASILSSG